jgi:hypothetical protein
VSAITSWTCPTCRVTVTTPFCAQCGEEPIAASDLTLRGLVGKAIHAFTDVDARALRTAWTLIRRPGELTRAWANGARKAYVGPFQLFLLVNVLFFALQSVTGENVFSTSLDSHLHHQDWSALAQSALSQKLEMTHQSLEQYRPVFDRAVVLNAKSLILLMTFPFTLLLPLAFLPARRPFMTHFVLSLHLYTFLLLLFCAALLMAKVSTWLGWGGMDLPMIDNVLTAFILVVCALYVYVATEPVYGAHGVRRVVGGCALAVAVAAIVIGYRFVLFFITLQTT